ncbi:MAG: hypothetical protein JXA90_00495 [Planctomycetes bacterium]|nr:hypothetical protein [Planctomycetota bacterium]
MQAREIIPLGSIFRRARRWSAIAVALFAGSVSAGGAEYHVDAEDGRDGEGRGGPDQPLQTIAFALRDAVSRGETDVTVRLAEGILLGGEPADGGIELLPLAVPPALRRLVIEGPPRGGGVASVEVIDSQLAVLTSDPEPPGGGDGGPPAEVHLERLIFFGGHRALSVAGAAGRELLVTARSCYFSNLAASALEFIPGPGARARLEVVDCDFWYSGGAIALEALEGADVEVEIRESRFGDALPLGAEGLLGGAVELHLDPRSRISARIERSAFYHTGVAIALTSSDEVGESAGLSASITGNLFYSTNSPFCDMDFPMDCGLYCAFYLALAPDLAVDASVYNNTFWAVQRQVVYPERVEVNAGVSRQLRFRNNIFWGPADHRFPTGSLAGEPGYLPPGVSFERNLVPAAWMAGQVAESNLSADPRFVNEYEDDFRLLADSPAIDAGDASVREEVGRYDFDGSCRRARGAEASPPSSHRIDLGAFELSGPCDPDLLLAFLRGDCDLNDRLELSDAIRVFSFLFLGGASPSCEDACDSTDDGRLDITDGIYVLSYLFLGGREPPAPFSMPGPDTTADALADCFEGPEGT